MFYGQSDINSAQLTPKSPQLTLHQQNESLQALETNPLFAIVEDAAGLDDMDVQIPTPNHPSVHRVTNDALNPDTILLPISPLLPSTNGIDSLSSYHLSVAVIELEVFYLLDQIF